jgi:hypothetical protein
VFAIDIETRPERRLSRHGGLHAAQEALTGCAARGPSTDDYAFALPFGESRP